MKLLALATLASTVIGCKIKNEEYIILLPWPNELDSLRYITDVSKFDRIWSRLDSGHPVDLACGYSFNIYRSSRSSKKRWIGSVNKECSTIADSSMTYFKQDHRIAEIESLSMPGIIRIDKAIDEDDAKHQLKIHKDNRCFLGSSLDKHSDLIQFTSTNKGECESNPLYDSLAYARILTRRKSQINPCTDRHGEQQICGELGEYDISELAKIGYIFDSKKIMITFPTYWKCKP